MQTETMTAIQFHKELEEAAKNSPMEVRDVSAMKVGEHSRQGDVYQHRIKEAPAAWDVEVKEHSQVALGQTMGSRHCADGAKIKVLWPKSRDLAVTQCPISLFKDNDDFKRVALGPIVVAESEWTLTHPEHAHHKFGPGVYLTTYQVDWNTRREVRD